MAQWKPDTTVVSNKGYRPVLYWTAFIIQWNKMAAVKIWQQIPYYQCMGQINTLWAN